MSDESHSWFQRNVKTERGRLRVAIGLLGVLDLAIIFLAAYPRTAKWFNPAWLIGSLGVVTFLGYYMIENYVRKEITGESGGQTGVQNAVVQNAIAATFMIVYFAVMGQVLFGASAAETETAKTLIGNFTTLFQFVIAFYFGAKTATAVSNAVISQRSPPAGDGGGEDQPANTGSGAPPAGA
jgi:hypothetical protein